MKRINKKLQMKTVGSNINLKLPCEVATIVAQYPTGEERESIRLTFGCC